MLDKIIDFIKNTANKTLFLFHICRKNKELYIFLLSTILLPFTEKQLFFKLFIICIVIFLICYNTYSQKIFLLRQYVYLYIESRKISTGFFSCCSSNDEKQEKLRIYDSYIPKKVYENNEICKSCLPKLDFKCKEGYPMFPCCNDRIAILTGKFDNEIIKLFNEGKIKLDL